MNAWERFLNSLATNGGTIFCLILLTFFGYMMVVQHLPKGEDILYLVLGAFLGILKSRDEKATGKTDAA